MKVYACNGIISRSQNKSQNKFQSKAQNKFQNSYAQNFGSKVTRVITPDGSGLSQGIKDFIDAFEVANPKNSDGIRNMVTEFKKGIFSLEDVAKQGLSGKVHKVTKNGFDSSVPEQFMIKEQNPLKYFVRYATALGGIKYEYDKTVEANRIEPDKTAKAIAYVETEEGGKYLLTKFIDNMKEVSGHTTGKGGNTGVAPITEEYLRSTMSTLRDFDEQGFFNPDLNRGNIQQVNNDARFIDFQWATTSSTDRDNLFTFAPFEAKSNIAAFEANVIADYGISLLDKNSEDGAQKVRSAVKNYLNVRAEFADDLSQDWSYDKGNSSSAAFEQIKAKVYKNASDDVIDAELLRMSILRNHRLQYLYTDNNIETPRNMMKLVQFSALAKNAADKLVEFASTVTPKDENEKKYFEYMKEYGKFWQGKSASWYPATVNYLKSVASGSEKADGKFFEEKFGKTKAETILLTNALRDSTKNKINMTLGDMNDLDDEIHALESTIMKYHLKRNDNSTYSKYSSLVNELYRN